MKKFSTNKEKSTIQQKNVQKDMKKHFMKKENKNSGWNYNETVFTS